jgi:hypothetical protein
MVKGPGLSALRIPFRDSRCSGSLPGMARWRQQHTLLVRRFVLWLRRSFLMLDRQRAIMGGHFLVMLAGNGVGRTLGSFFKHASTFNEVFGVGHRDTSPRSSNPPTYMGFSCCSQIAAGSNHRVATRALSCNRSLISPSPSWRPELERAYFRIRPAFPLAADRRNYPSRTSLVPRLPLAYRCCSL